jgi:hypothetical protein
MTDLRWFYALSCVSLHGPDTVRDLIVLCPAAAPLLSDWTAQVSKEWSGSELPALAAQAT